MRRYRSRVIDGEVESVLAALGAVVIEGPRACGKTATGLHHAASSVRLDTDTDTDALGLARIEPSLLLRGAAAPDR